LARSIAASEKKLPREDVMQCVKCDGELKKVDMHGVEVDQCEACSGIWFDFGELEKVLAQDDVAKLKNVVDNNQGDDARRAPCPSCGGDGKMVPVVSARDHGIHIDTCIVCYGQWLDGGELERLKEAGLFDSVAGFFKKLV
jgi:Zn-finger nucleic acid-binding protein